MSDDPLDSVRSGYLPAVPSLTDWRAGLETGVAADRDVPDWAPFLPEGERQYRPGRHDAADKVFDTLSCVSFSVAHSLEAQANYLLPSLAPGQRRLLQDAGFIDGTGRVRLSPRWLASRSGTTTSGNSFPRVLEAARKRGMVPDADWPFAPSLSGFDDWIADPPASLDAKSEVFLKVFDLAYDWLFWQGDHLSQAQKLARVRAALPTCPVLVGRPWCRSCDPSRVRPGVPIPDCGVEAAGHATMIYGLEDDSDQLVRDTYPPFNRVFDDGYWIQHAMRAVLTARQPAPDPGVPAAPYRQCHQGDRSDAVSDAQRALAHLGYLKVRPTGYYGPLTAEAVWRFQRAAGIVPTAPDSVGPKTLQAFLKALA